METRNHEQYVGLIRSQAQNHSRTQQEILKQKEKKAAPLNQLKAFLEVNVFGWIYHYFKSRFGKRHPFMEYTSAQNKGIFEMYSEESGDTTNIKMVLAADWASYTSESKKIGELMANENSDYSIHLGDTYFVGAPPEIYCNFIDPNGGWPKGRSGFLALPGNHEFYCNGNPYFETLLDATYIKANSNLLRQEASYFCLQNKYWRVLGLDTGYHSVGRPLIEFIIKPDAHLDDKIVSWLEKEVKLCANGDNRGLIILTHHQYCSAFEGRFASAAEVLLSLLPEDKKDTRVIWIWGHEHRLAVYGEYASSDGIKAYGRCIGHGGMPPEIGTTKAGENSYKLPAEKQAKENNLVFYDIRQKGTIGNHIIGHNGYVVFNFEDAKVHIEYKDENTWLFKETWEVDLSSGKIKGVTAENNTAEHLSLFASDFGVAIK